MPTIQIELTEDEIDRGCDIYLGDASDEAVSVFWKLREKLAAYRAANPRKIVVPVEMTRDQVSRIVGGFYDGWDQVVAACHAALREIEGGR